MFSMTSLIKKKFSRQMYLHVLCLVSFISSYIIKMENYHFRKQFMLQDLSTSHFSPNQRKCTNILARTGDVDLFFGIVLGVPSHIFLKLFWDRMRLAPRKRLFKKSPYVRFGGQSIIAEFQFSSPDGFDKPRMKVSAPYVYLLQAPLSSNIF